MKQLVVVALVFTILLAACGGSGDAEPTDAVDTVGTQIAAGIQATLAAQSTPTAAQQNAPTPTNTPAPEPTSTNTAVPPTETPQPTNTPRPTRTPVPTATPTPVDLAQYMISEADSRYPITTVVDKEETGAFLHKDGLVQGWTRTVARTDNDLAYLTFCAEYDTTENAKDALDTQYQGYLGDSSIFSGVEDDDHSAIEASNAYLVRGISHLGDEDRPMSIALYQDGRVMCFNVILGIRGSEVAPRGGAIDLTNAVLERLTAASAPTPTAIPGGTDVWEIGQKVTYTDGFSITVTTVEDPVVAYGEAVSPRASIVLVGVEIEACAGPETTGASIGPLDIAVALDNNTRAERSYGLVKQPELDSARLFPGECIRGWVTFERHWEPRPTYVIVDALGYSTFRVKAR